MLKFIAVGWLALSFLKLTGLCFSQLGWNSDIELIEAAFEYEAKYKALQVPDVKAYVGTYPSCCAVRGLVSLDDDVPVLNTLLNAIFLRRFYQVEIKYPVSDPAHNDGEPFYEAILVMDCCGSAVPDRYGTTSSTPIPRAAN